LRCICFAALFIHSSPHPPPLHLYLLGDCVYVRISFPPSLSSVMLACCCSVVSVCYPRVWQWMPPTVVVPCFVCVFAAHAHLCDMAASATGAAARRFTSVRTQHPIILYACDACQCVTNCVPMRRVLVGLDRAHAQHKLPPPIHAAPVCRVTASAVPCPHPMCSNPTRPSCHPCTPS